MARRDVVMRRSAASVLLLACVVSFVVGVDDSWDSAFKDVTECMNNVQFCTQDGRVRFAESRRQCEETGGTWNQVIASGEELKEASGRAEEAIARSGLEGVYLARLADGLVEQVGENNIAQVIECPQNGVTLLVLELSSSELATVQEHTFAFAMPSALKQPAWQEGYMNKQQLTGKKGKKRVLLSRSAHAQLAGRRLQGEPESPWIEVDLEDTSFAKVPGQASALRSVLTEEDVASRIVYQEPVIPSRLFNLATAHLTHGGVDMNDNVQTSRDFLSPIWSKGITGAGQIVGVADTGIDTEHCFFRDPSVDEENLKTSRRNQRKDFVNTSHRKVVLYGAVKDGLEEVVQDKTGRVSPGHGTHVAGTVAGKCVQTTTTPSPAANAHKGIAFEAKIAFVDIDSAATPDSLEIGSSSDLTNLYAKQKSNGAFVSSHSWGSVDLNVYDVNAQVSDGYMFDNQDFLLIFAAGNSGTEGDASLGSPGVAKNVLTVGASVSPENTWRAGGFDCRANNLAESQPFRTSGSCKEDLAFFSSRGPTNDGRIKPEIVAPGHFIVSAGFTNLNPFSGESSQLDILQGTSMATPVVAGNAVLVRQFFTDGYFPTGGPVVADKFTPMGALIKAVLVNCARALRGFESGAKSAPPLLARGYPSNTQGWGLVQLNRTLFSSNTKALTVDGDFNKMSKLTVEGESKSYTAVLAQGEGLSVTLAWSDRAPTSTQAKLLVNDLNLQITCPNGTVLHPNGRSSPDDRNNLEHISVFAEDSFSGTYTIKVTFFKKGLLSPAQPYALVIHHLKVAEPKVASSGDSVTLPPVPSPTSPPASPTDLLEQLPENFVPIAVCSGVLLVMVSVAYCVYKKVRKQSAMERQVRTLQVKRPM